MKKLLSLLFLASFLLVLSCGKDDDSDDCNTENITYTNDIKAILDTNCAQSGCHSEAELTTVGSLATYEHAVAFVAFGRISGAINHDDGFEAMPRPEGSDKLDDCTIDKIEAWIAAGTPQ